MGYAFNADEVFMMAEKMEQNGARFYRDAAGRVDDADKKNFLEELSYMEDQHEKMFKVMRAELTEQEKVATVFDPDGEAGLYLNALVDTRVFFKKEIDLSSMEGILKAAIEAEKDSIIFYLGMKAGVPENFGKGKIEHIIKEEMNHVRVLSNELSSLKK